MARRRKHEEEGPKGCPEWMVTFSDVISLLVTFFVMILTFSTMEIQEFQKLAGSLRGGFGVLSPSYTSNRDGFYPKDVKKSDRRKERGGDIPFTRDLKEIEEDLDDLKAQKRLDKELKIDQIETGLRIRIEGERLFNPGAVTVRQEFIPILKRLAEILSYYPNELRVEGHTDSTVTGKDGTAWGYEIAGEMARKTAEVLIREGSIQPGRIAIASFGASVPLASNETPKGRARNRRVEVIVLKDREGY